MNTENPRSHWFNKNPRIYARRSTFWLYWFVKGDFSTGNLLSPSISPWGRLKWHDTARRIWKSHSIPPRSVQKCFLKWSCLMGIYQTQALPLTRPRKLRRNGAAGRRCVMAHSSRGACTGWTSRMGTCVWMEYDGIGMGFSAFLGLSSNLSRMDVYHFFRPPQPMAA